MNFLRSINHFLSQHVLPKDTLILAVSGGRDSMCMLHLMQQLKHKFIVAHCNFQLRGEESDEEEAFVKGYCEVHSIPFLSKSFPTLLYSQNQKKGIQETARILRYNWFKELLVENNAQFVLTAHHANDNAETLLFNLSRGTEINGLKGIPERADRILRPLLKFSDQQIQNYAAANKVPYRTDSSNSSDKYSRNFIRHQVIPKLEELNPESISHMNEAIDTITDLAQIAERYFLTLEEKFITKKGTQILVHLNRLHREPQHELFLKTFLLRFGFKKSIQDEIKRAKQTGARWFSSSHQLTLNRGDLILTHLKTQTDDLVLTTITPGTLTINNIHLELEIMETPPRIFEKNKWYLDIGKITPPVIIRGWIDGDSFSPLGMSGKHKKVSDYLIDKKVSLPEKEQCLIMEDQQKICLVYPFSISDQVKIDLTNSSKILVISTTNS